MKKKEIQRLSQLKELEKKASETGSYKERNFYKTMLENFCKELYFSNKRYND